MPRFLHSATRRALLILASASVAACAPPPDTGDGATATANPTGNGAGGGLDESQLDRSADGQCGCPAGPYGAGVGERLANTMGFNLESCDGDVVEFATASCVPRPATRRC